MFNFYVLFVIIVQIDTAVKDEGKGLVTTILVLTPINYYSPSQGGRGGRVVRWYWVNFQCPVVFLIWITMRQGPTVLTVGADWDCLDIFLSSICSVFYLLLFGGRSDIVRNTI